MLFVLTVVLFVLIPTDIFNSALTYHDVTTKNLSFIASVATNNDVNTIWSNPSNVDHIEQLQFSFTYGLPMFRLKGSEYISKEDNINYEPEIIENVFSSGSPLKKYGYVGVGIYRLSLGNFFSDSLFFISYGRKVIGKFLAGCALKIFYREFGKDRYTQYYEIFRTKGYTKSDFTIDLAATYRLTEHLNYAIVLHNITRPNLSLSNTSEDKFPVVVRTGFGINMHRCKFGLEIDHELISEITKTTKFFVSAEFIIIDKLSFSSTLGLDGIRYYSFSSGVKVNVTNNFSIGYTFKYPMSGLRNVLFHKIGIDFYFQPEKKKTTAVLQKVEQEKVKKTSQEQKTKLRIRSSLIKKLKKHFTQ